MSRFDPARWGRIVTWTGAALAWGTAVAIAGLKPTEAAATTEPSTTAPPPTTTEVAATQHELMPSQPSDGLVILRYRPSADEAPEVQTVYVRKKAPATSDAPKASPQPAPSPPVAPAPRSNGS